MSRPQKFFFNPDGDQSKIAEASSESLVLIQETFEHLNQLRTIRDAAIKKVQIGEAACPHEFFYDVAGMPYDVRHCAVCDKCIGMV